MNRRAFFKSIGSIALAMQIGLPRLKTPVLEPVLINPYLIEYEKLVYRPSPSLQDYLLEQDKRILQALTFTPSSQGGNVSKKSDGESLTGSLTDS